MDEEKLDPVIKSALIDNLESWELMEFLEIFNIDMETLIETFEDKIVENLDEVYDVLGIIPFNDEGD